jgi:crossover junction endodeoxyribonuclease RuvC
MESPVKRFIAACDPGKTGALSLLDETGTIIELEDMPIRTWNGKKKIVFKKGVPVEEFEKKWEFDRKGISDILEKWALLYDASVIWVEEISPRPGISGHSAFTMGLNAGLIYGAAQAWGYKIEDVTPQKWKKVMRVTEDKKSSLTLIRDLYKGDPRFKLEEHHNRAESVLIARYGLQHGG